MLKFYCHLLKYVNTVEHKSGKKKIYYSTGTAMLHREFQKRVMEWMKDNKRDFRVLTRHTIWVVLEADTETLAMLMLVFPEGKFTRLKEKIVYELV